MAHRSTGRRISNDEKFAYRVLNAPFTFRYRVSTSDDSGAVVLSLSNVWSFGEALKVKKVSVSVEPYGDRVEFIDAIPKSTHSSTTQSKSASFTLTLGTTINNTKLLIIFTIFVRFAAFTCCRSRECDLCPNGQYHRTPNVE